MYRFGDGTPFPIQENFIETLLAGVDAAVGAFAAAAELDERRDKALAARREADDELRRFTIMDKAIEAALTPMMPSADRTASSTQQTAARAMAAARHAIGQSRAQVEQRLAQLAGEPRTARAAERLRAAMSAFFEHHALPDTAWRWMWNATGKRAAGETMALTGRFRAMFDLELDGAWTGVVRVGALVPGLEAMVPRRGMFGRIKRKRIALDRCGLVGVERSPDRHVLMIREHAAKASAGWKVMLRDPERSGTTLVAIDPTGRAIGNEMSLDGDQAAPFVRLWDQADAALVAMRDDRRRLRDLRIGDVALDTIGDPAVVGRAVLGVLGPIVVQMRSRSRGTGELTLKRDIGDGRREELYVPRQSLERKFAMLPPGYRRPFEDIGLGRAATEELVNDEMQTMPDTPLRGPAEPRPGPPPPPPMRAAPDAPTRALPALGPLPGESPRLPLPSMPTPPPVPVSAQPTIRADALAKLPAVPPTLPRVPLKTVTA